MRDLLLALALTFLALGGSTCSSSSDGKKNDAAADSSGGDGGGSEDCQVSGCGPDLECQQCLGVNGESVYVCVPVDSACQ